MNAIFKNDNLDKLEIDATFDGGWESGIVKAFRKRMQQIRAAGDERDFYNLKSLHFEKLSGKRKHQYSMRLNDQWRLIVELEGSGESKKVVVICIEDYH
jgi:proteic killer suppression protein